jgi:hypothetical protein
MSSRAEPSARSTSIKETHVAAPTESEWQHLAQQLTRSVAVFAPDWTEPTESDPGVTIVELFAFLAESLLEQADGSTRTRARLQEVLAQLQRADVLRCRDGTLTRVNYFSGQLLSAEDFEQEQQYHRTRQRRHNRLLHGAGIVHGLDVSVAPGKAGAGPVVTVSPGIAIAPDGEELVVCEEATEPVGTGTASRFVTVGLVEHRTTARVEESAAITVRQDVSPGHLVIARLTRRGKAWQTDPSFQPARVDR